MEIFANQDLVEFANVELGTFASPGASRPQQPKEFGRMIGKLLGAWVGEKIAGRNSGAKGAI